MALVLAAACGVEVVGVAPEDGGALLAEPDASALLDGGAVDGDGEPRSSDGMASDVMVLDGAPVDAAHDGGIDASSCDRSCAALTLAQSGFAPVAFGDGPCPSGFDSADVVEGPLAQVGSCGCGACTATGASCGASSFQTRTGSGSQCSTGSTSNHTTNGGNCQDINGGFGGDYSVLLLQPPTAVGTCQAAGEVIPAKIDKTARRLCTRRGGTCAAAICDLPTSLVACLVTDGDVACPGSAPNKHLVGADVTATCAACGCTPNATCNGTFAAFSGTSCGGTQKVTLTNTCTLVNQATFNSYRLTQTVGQTCTNVTPASKADVSLTVPRTVCCP